MQKPENILPIRKKIVISFVVTKIFTTFADRVGRTRSAEVALCSKLAKREPEKFSKSKPIETGEQDSYHA